MEQSPRRTGLPPFEQVVALYGPSLLRFCAAQVGGDRAEDVFQETMLSALRAYDGVRDPSALRSWLYAIAVRKALDAHRARARSPEPVADLDPEAGPGEAETDDELWEHVRALPAKQRQAVALRFLADLSHREIATAMETSEEAARRSVFEGLNRLRARLAAETDERKIR